LPGRDWSPTLNESLSDTIPGNVKGRSGCDH